MKYSILVRYRTNSGCNARRVEVEAESIKEALQLASDKVRRMRGVVKIDGGEWHASGCMRETFEAIRSRADGPIKKFELIKIFGGALKASGVADPRALSCKELESKIAGLDS
jgi:hypothetical protein